MEAIEDWSIEKINTINDNGKRQLTTHRYPEYILHYIFKIFNMYFLGAQHKIVL